MVCRLVVPMRDLLSDGLDTTKTDRGQRMDRRHGVKDTLSLSTALLMVATTPPNTETHTRRK